MAITLVGGITAAQTTAILSAPLAADSGDLFRLDDESVAFGGYYRVNRRLVDRKHIVIRRGEGGTTPATHAHGTSLRGVADALTSAADQSFPDPFTPSAGEAQTISLLGPVTFDFDDLGSAPGETGFLIPAGAIVVKAWAVIKTNGDTEAGAKIWLAVAPVSDFETATILSRYDAFDGYIPPTDYAFIEMGPLNSTDETQVLRDAPRSAIAVSDVTIIVLAGGALADGSIDVYALIAEPS